MKDTSLVSKAVDLKASGRCNCCQAVALPFAGHTSLTPDQLMAVASPFGGGMGTGQGTCGAIVGAGLIMGLIYADRSRAKAAMRRLMEGFKARAGATTCRVLKGVDTGRVLCPCNDCVAYAAILLEAEVEMLDVSRDVPLARRC